MSTQRKVESNDSYLPVVISSSDLNTEWFEDKESADLVSADCLRLFETSEADFRAIREQAWFKRLWGTLGGGNLRAVAAGCETAAKAQQLLFVTLQTHAQTSATSHALMQAVAGGLNHVRYQQNQVARSILGLAGRVSLVESELALHRRQLNADPSNEHTWNQEQRLLLWKVLVVGANLRGQMSHRQREVLQRRLEQLRLTGPYADEASSLNPKTLNVMDELCRVDSNRMRVTIFRNAVGMLFEPDGFDAFAQQSLNRLAEKLRLSTEDKMSVINTFLRHDSNLSLEQHVQLMSGGSSDREMAPARAEYALIDQQREALVRAAQERAREMAQVVESFDEISDAWKTSVGEYFAFHVFDSYVHARETLNGLLEEGAFSHIATVADFDHIWGSIIEQINELPQACSGVLKELSDTFAVSRVAENQMKLDLVKDNGEHLVVYNALGRFADLAQAVTYASSNDMGTFWKAAGVGALATFAFGPFGLIGAMIGSGMSGYAGEKRDEETFDQWLHSDSELHDACLLWSTSIQSNVMVALERGLLELRQHISNAPDVVTASEPLRKMLSDLGDLEFEGTFNQPYSRQLALGR